MFQRSSFTIDAFHSSLGLPASVFRLGGRASSPVTGWHGCSHKIHYKITVVIPWCSACSRGAFGAFLLAFANNSKSNWEKWRSSLFLSLTQTTWKCSSPLIMAARLLPFLLKRTHLAQLLSESDLSKRSASRAKFLFPPGTETVACTV